ncbi:hypothetical protein O0L34_g8639 [Tuta absoluta]|nr:hypothetical protein O0L34_g8639 [Tuta absoluta]
MELINASASSEMKVRHFCPRQLFNMPCYRYRGSIFDISVYLMYAGQCSFQVNVWGVVKDLKLLDMTKWRWEEGSYYEDFTMRRVEYRGPAHMTSFGFEPLDQSMWLPVYDMYTTTSSYDPYSTEPTNSVWKPSMDGRELVSSDLGPKKEGQFDTFHKGRGRVKLLTTTKKFIYIQGFLGP